MSILGKIQRTQPLILNLANFVTPQRVADVISFIGASPLMTSEIAELESLVEISDAVVVNIGRIDLSSLFRSLSLGKSKSKTINFGPSCGQCSFQSIHS